MKVVFVSNYLTHHQLPFCRAMSERLGDNFCFIETEKMAQDRLDLGWEIKDVDNINVIQSYMDDKAYEKTCKEIWEADAVIIGGTKDKYIEERLKENKLIFRYAERIFKRSWLKVLDPRMLHMIYATHVRCRRKNVYMLCASAYLPQELKLFHLYKNKMFKWGYFPETYHYNMEELMGKKQHQAVEILWCARFIDWKHPEKVIAIAEKLVQQKLCFHITMIGEGELKAATVKEISKKNLGRFISVLGAVSSKEVRNYMEVADIFLATSDRNEGWGAVINEAMNSGCVVVADRMMGAVPYLMKNDENGYVYKNNKECFLKLKILIENEEKRRQLSINAYKTIVSQWNAENAAEILLEMIEGILEKNILNVPVMGIGSSALRK